VASPLELQQTRLLCQHLRTAVYGCLMHLAIRYSITYRPLTICRKLKRETTQRDAMELVQEMMDAISFSILTSNSARSTTSIVCSQDLRGYIRGNAVREAGFINRLDSAYQDICGSYNLKSVEKCQCSGFLSDYLYRTRGHNPQH
jgi:hypothetical protein